MGPEGIRGAFAHVQAEAPDNGGVGNGTVSRIKAAMAA
jgi:hypothetical protein